ncbi:MAG TPA: PQQ-dependent sugar dehydrogenase [Anaerolineales bacterium]
MFFVVNRIRWLLVFALILTACRPAVAPRVSLELVAAGFTSPVALAEPQDGRLFVADQVGVIWIISRGRKSETPFLDLRGGIVKLSDFYDERGLLGLAFHPDFPRNGRFYVSYSARVRHDAPPGEWDHTTYISEFTVSPAASDRADPASERILLAIDKPGYNYEAGDLAFGPDGYLYISTGDSVRDPATEAGQFAQDTDSLLGKILRIDVNAEEGERPYGIPTGNPFAQAGGRPEIFALGFRNPYRFSFDPSGGSRLFVGDVGQAVMEEVSLVSAGGNYGWPVREGTTCFNPRVWNEPLPSCASAGMTDPIISYRHEADLSAVIGGTVYSSSSLHALEGGYIYGDWGRGNGHLFVAFPPPLGAGRWRSTEIEVTPPAGQTGIGQLLDIEQWGGELYLLVKDPGLGPVGDTGKVFRIVSP